MDEDQSNRRPLGIVFLAIAILFITIAPTLSTVEFSRTLENLNVATALEARRDGHWFVPTLEGQPRTKKPPLMAWITGLAMSPKTVAECSRRDPAVREAAFRRLAFEARWPALLQAGLTLLAVYHLGRIVAGRTVGAIAALICASSYLFIRYAQVAVTDVPLMLWVITANAFIALALFERRYWAGCIGAGVGIGLAFLSKGPVALLETVAPLAVWGSWKWRHRQTHDPLTPTLSPDNTGGFPLTSCAAPAVPGERGLMPILVGGLVCLAVGLPWYLAVLLRDPHAQWSTWFKEVTGTDAPERADSFSVYGLFVVVMLFPWIAFWVGGLWLALLDSFRGTDSSRPARLPKLGDRFVFLLFLVLVPLVVMLFFKDKKDRYLLPMIGPAAVITARCIVAYFTERPRDVRRDWVGWLHWGVLAGVGLGLPILGAVGIKGMLTLEDRPWYSPAFAAGAVGIIGALLAIGLWTHLSRRGGMVLVTLVLMLVISDVFMHGYRETKNGRSQMRPLAEKIWQEYPDAQVYALLPFGERASVDLSIYMNRPTGWITLEEMARPAARTRIVLLKQSQRRSVPSGWELLLAIPQNGGEAWQAFARAGENDEVMPSSRMRKP